MRRHTLSSSLVLFAITGAGIAAFAPDALGQSLSDRIQHVHQQRAQQEARNTQKAEILGALLYTDLTLQFDETAARDVFDFLENAMGIEIIARYSDDQTGGFGIDPEQPISLNVADTPALTVLEMILEQCSDFEQCTWQLRRGFLEVGTKDRLGARGAQEVRYYPIADLLFEAPMFDNAPDLDLDSALNQGQGGGGGGGGFGGGSGGGGGGRGGGGSLFGEPGEDPERATELEKAEELMDLIRDSVEPEAWNVMGGEWASMRYYKGTLIIRAPDFIHRQIGGYPFAIRPHRPAVVQTNDRRYVTFTGSVSNVEVTEFRDSPEFGGAAGGR